MLITNKYIEIPENGINYYTKRIEYRANQSKPESKHTKREESQAEREEHIPQQQMEQILRH